jgi:membrane fusion protein (multidrug efflux system)
MRPFLPLILTALCLAGCGAKKAEKPRTLPMVEAGPIASADFTDALEAVGTALANEQVVLSAPVTERITSLNFSDGGYVGKGQVVATLAVGQEKAELASAEATALQASQQLQRIQALKTRGFATGATLEQQVATANAARASADLARASIGDRIIRAPFAGWVSLRTVSPGAIVTAGTAIATVSDISRIKLDFTIPETRLSMIREGMPIRAVSAAWPADGQCAGPPAPVAVHAGTGDRGRWRRSLRLRAGRAHRQAGEGEYRRAAKWTGGNHRRAEAGAGRRHRRRGQADRRGEGATGG